MAAAVDEEARKTPGKRQLALEAFARALRQLPTIVADNAGYDSADLVARVRAAWSGMSASDMAKRGLADDDGFDRLFGRGGYSRVPV